MRETKSSWQRQKLHVWQGKMASTWWSEGSGCPVGEDFSWEERFGTRTGFSERWCNLCPLGCSRQSHGRADPVPVASLLGALGWSGLLPQRLQISIPVLFFNLENQSLPG